MKVKQELTKLASGVLHTVIYTYTHVHTILMLFI